jgi:hypothetical protein
MANFEAIEEDGSKVTFVKLREDGSLIIESRYYDPVKGGFAGMDEVNLLPEGVRKLKALLDRDAQLRIGADEAGQNGACQHNFVVSSNKEWYAECVKCGMKVAPF